MCPACFANAVVIAAGAGSTGGVLAVCIAQVRGKLRAQFPARLRAKFSVNFRKFFQASGLGLFQKIKEKQYGNQ